MSQAFIAHSFPRFGHDVIAFSPYGARMSVHRNVIGLYVECRIGILERSNFLCLHMFSPQ